MVNEIREIAVVLLQCCGKKATVDRCPLLRQPAAVDIQRRAGDLDRGITAQKTRELADLLRRDEILGRLFLLDQVDLGLLEGHAAFLRVGLDLLAHQGS